jgi:biopolymer transport protein ExbD
MRFRNRQNGNDQGVLVNMTPMIDVVFQLIAFFVMTFRVAAEEGDFNIRMPLASNRPIEEQIEKVTTLVTVRLKSGAEGQIAAIDVDNGIDADHFAESDLYSKLTQFIEKSMTGEGDPSSATETEVEFEIDYVLKYQYTVRAIEAVSGKVQADGTIKTLVEKIKFRDATN